MSVSSKRRRHPTGNSPTASDDDTTEQTTSSSSQVGNKRRGSVASDFASHRLIVSERQQMAVLKQLTAGDESNTGSQSPSSTTHQTRPTKIHRRNEHGETIVHIAARRGDVKQLRKVLKAGANVNETDNAGWTPLHEAVTKNQFKTARLLLKSGANVNAPGPEGQTPLVDAVLNNNTKMAELLLNYSADSSAVQSNTLNETMSKVLKRELSVLDSSENENNDDDSSSSLSSLTSDEGTHDEEKFDEKKYPNLDQHEANEKTTILIPRKKAYRRFRDQSSQSSDSSPNKSRTVSGNNEANSSVSTGNKNPYDFESEEEGEIRETPSDIHEDQTFAKKKLTRKQRTQSGNSNQSAEASLNRKRFNRSEIISREQEQHRSKVALEDEQVQQIHRIPPLKIVLARAVLQRASDFESAMTSNIDENSSSNTDQSALSIAMPIIDSDEKVVSSDIINSNTDVDSKVINPEEEQTQHSQSAESNEMMIDDSRHLTNIDNPDVDDADDQERCQTLIASVLQTIIGQIEGNIENPSSSSGPNENESVYMDDEGEDEIEDEEDGENNLANNQSPKSTKTERERHLITTISTKISSKNDSKPVTRTLRSHARGKYSSSTTVQSPLSNVNQSHGRRVSNRRRALEAKSLIISSDRERKRRNERSRRDKDNTSTNNEDLQTSSNSDDQNTENSNQLDKLNNTNDDASSCSSQGAGEGSSTSSSTIATKQSTADIENLPPNKRRLRDRGIAIPSTINESTNSGQSTMDTIQSDVSPAREIPTNSIKQFLEIRQEIEKRHQNMLKEFVMPKVPREFSETTMAKKNYLIASSHSRRSNSPSTPTNIKRLNPPSELDAHLVEVFVKQEDERYRMKLRHQVERDKLILSHEQEVLRLYGNAARSSTNQEAPFSFCSLLKDEEVYNNPSIQSPEKERNSTLFNSDYSGNEPSKRGKHRWNGRFLFKCLEESNSKYKRLSLDLNERQRLEAETLYSMQRMVWSKHLPKDSLNLTSSGRSSYFLNERFLPKVEINPNFWTHWEPSPTFT